MKVVTSGISSNHNQTQREAKTVSTGVNMLTSAAEAWRVADTMHNRAIGPTHRPIANVDKRARLSSA